MSTFGQLFSRGGLPVSPIIHFERCAKFFSSTRVSGAFLDRPESLREVSPIGTGIEAIQWSTTPRASANGVSTELNIQTLNRDGTFPNDAGFKVEWVNGAATSYLLTEVAQAVVPVPQLQSRFFEWVARDEFRNVLDIGGRARSGLLRAAMFPNNLVTVLDIVADEGVDVVCDAHQLSAKFPTGSFDAVFSSFAYEHLVMPWKVAIEINRVLRVGGIGFVATHQTVGMHDSPWDYFRFSDSAWRGIFNVATGFEILQTEMASPQYIIPMHYADRHAEAEKTAGFEFSSVLFRKVSETNFDWPLSAANVVTDSYPT